MSEEPQRQKITGTAPAASNEAAEPQAGSLATASFAVQGMTCRACTRHVSQALTALAGVSQAQVDLAQGKAKVTYNPELTTVDDMQAAVEGAGYGFGEGQADERSLDCCSLPGGPGLTHRPRPYLFGLAAMAAVIGFYLGLVTLTSNWHFAKVQFSEYRWWLIALALGLGLQVTLFGLFRATLQNRARRAAGSALAASSGVSGLAMAACCSHYLAALLPALGMPFLSGAVAAVEQYQSQFFLLGVISNLLGIWVMLRMMARHNMLNPKSGLLRVPLGLGRAV